MQKLAANSRMHKVRNILYILSIVTVTLFYSTTTFAGDIPETNKKDSCKNTFLNQSDPKAIEARVIGSLISEKVIRTHLAYLTGQTPILFSLKIPDRMEESHKELARLYIFETLQGMGLAPRIEKFEGGVNIVVDIEGSESPTEFFEVSAHYDTAGKGVPGADDNGSGLTTALEMARIFSAHQPRKSLRIAFLDLEERGMGGSRHHAAKLIEEFRQASSDESKSFIGSLVIDMIGYNPTGEDQKVVLELGTSSDYKSGKESDTHYGLAMSCATEACYQFLRFSEQSKRGEIKLSIEVDTALPGTGDHGSYWAQGLPALFLAAPYKGHYINPGYHSANDEVAKMNFKYFIPMARFATEIVARMVSPNLENRFLTESNVALQEEKTSVELSDQTRLGLVTEKPALRSYSYDSSYSDSYDYGYGSYSGYSSSKSPKNESSSDSGSVSSRIIPIISDETFFTENNLVGGSPVLLVDSLGGPDGLILYTEPNGNIVTQKVRLKGNIYAIRRDTSESGIPVFVLRASAQKKFADALSDCEPWYRRKINELTSENGENVLTPPLYFIEDNTSASLSYLENAVARSKVKKTSQKKKTKKSNKKTAVQLDSPEVSLNSSSTFSEDEIVN